MLLAKRGVAAPKEHPLNLAISRHKARLSAEFTKCRIRNGFATIEVWRTHINDSAHSGEGTNGSNGTSSVRPRWVRVNAVRTTLEKCLSTAFADYTRVTSLLDLKGTGKLIYIDENIPNLIAIPPRIDLSKNPAYLKGEIIIQDKASCFPAYLLNPQPEDGHVIDACAAPGNKTTHVAAIVSSLTSASEAKVTACERDKTRALTLKKMAKLAGAEKIVDIRAGQDFTRLDPNAEQFADVGALLLDPSCSGSGIVGRDDMPTLHLPSVDAGPQPVAGKKRKRKGNAAEKKVEEKEEVVEEEVTEETPESAEVENDEKKLAARLANLAAFQLKIILHAFKFPAATKVTYSTCSIHAEENENVVVKALASDIAKERGWRILPRKQQVEGMRKWQRRGNAEACTGASAPEVVAEACIKCEKGTEEGTMGFFVAAFVRDREAGEDKQQDETERDEEEAEDEWEGFD